MSSKTHAENKWARSDANEVSQDLLTSKVMIPPRREHSFHIFTCHPKVLENDVPSHPLGLPLAPQMGPKSRKGPFRNTFKFQCDLDCIQGLKMIPKWLPNQAFFFEKNLFSRGFPAHWSRNGLQRARSALRGLPRNAFPPNIQKPQQKRIQNLHVQSFQF